MNSLAVAIRSTVIPITIAAFAAYAFSWMEFRGRFVLFVAVVACWSYRCRWRSSRSCGCSRTGIAVRDTHLPDLDLNGHVPGRVVGPYGLRVTAGDLPGYGTAFGSLPSFIIESARMDGADHFTIFWRLIVPLSVPALRRSRSSSSSGSGDELLVAYVFLGGTRDVQVLTLALAGLNGSRGETWQLLTAAAFIAMALPLVVFFSLQKYFVRGLTAGSVKG